MGRVDNKIGIANENKAELEGLKIFYFLNLFFIWSDYLMPQYFGVNIGYDLTCTRIANLLIIFYVLWNRKLFNIFVYNVFLKCAITIPLMLYVLVTIYTMVFRADINAFFSVFFEVISLYMLAFGIRYVLGLKKTLKISIYVSYFLSVYGLIEYVAGHSLYLQFLRTMYTTVSNVYRSGHYRIMGPCGHPLGYGLLLLLLLALACVDLEQDSIFLLKRPALIVLLMLNIFLTGSRSTLGVAFLELLLLLVFSKGMEFKKSILGIVVVLLFTTLFIIVTYKLGIGKYLLMQIASVVDSAFGTTWSQSLGADMTALENSSEYRALLPKIFQLDWLNPWLGRGSRPFGAKIDDTYIRSVDSHYICIYIRYAYPGLVTYLLFIATTLISMMVAIIKYRSGIMKVTFIATVCYYINLIWVDTLQTLKYEYIIIAIFYACYFCYERWKERG